MEYSKELHKKARKIAVADSLTDKEVFALLDEIERLQTFEKAVDEWSKRVDAKLDNVTVKSNQVIQLMEHYRSECDRLQKLHEWIPVSERLPEVNDPVLTIYSARDGIGSIQKRCYVGSEMWYDFEDMRNISQRNVTHWQSLPTPPTEG